ncbi:DUF4145 domain-containing protein [Halopseudomonas sp. SMJS2]|uniref:DUF4145 domain-containing protein n=1 Tax=Halopseudomonas sp. SMJS2 TaxID=3041098 RepID=UPI002452A87A|nr:DUF4145 domain-containing protein [Halopseudomonas sp. SMJS2]WGK61866.1 DUF4145 domain-containing protein [Halopseudomonas sp. SMJS2]
MNNKLQKRFDELSRDHAVLLQSKRVSHGQLGSSEHVDAELFTAWKVKVRSLLSLACGEKSQHFEQYEKAEKPYTMESSFSVAQRLGAVFHAVKEDFEGGYLNAIKNLIQAEVFESELEQAQELLDNGYKLSAAVIAGVVLETALRDLCDQENISHGKLDKMNADLARSGKYNKLQQKRITALADIRNNAAHGKPENFTDEDVKLMVRDVEGFLLNFMA